MPFRLVRSGFAYWNSSLSMSGYESVRHILSIKHSEARSHFAIQEFLQSNMQSSPIHGRYSTSCRCLFCQIGTHFLSTLSQQEKHLPGLLQLQPQEILKYRKDFARKARHLPYAESQLLFTEIQFNLNRACCKAYVISVKTVLDAYFPF